VPSEKTEGGQGKAARSSLSKYARNIAVVEFIVIIMFGL
jgi:hypothetical protein